MGADGPHVRRIQIELHHRLQRDLIQKQPVRVVDGDLPAQLRQHEAAKRYGILAGEKESAATESVQRGQQTGRFGSFQFPDGVFIIKVAVVEALQCVQTGSTTMCTPPLFFSTRSVSAGRPFRKA